MRIVKILFALSILLVSCNLQPGYNDVNYHVGRDGLTLSMISESSLDNIYEESAFSVNYAVENEGAYDLIEDEFGIFTMSFDPFYIDATGVKSNANLEVNPGSLRMKGLKLAGKSKYMPSGQDLFLYFPGLKTKKITGQRAMPETQIFASVCYPYQTYFSKLVCVDFSVLDLNLREQVCRETDISSANQGAPVAISLVEVDNQPAGNNLVRPVFTLHVTNVGGGTLLSPVSSSEELERVCSATDLSRQDFNTVKVEATLSEKTQLVCTPEIVRLNIGEGLTRCTISDEELESTIAYRQNYQSPLTVVLSYVYLNTFSKDLEIQRVNYYPGSEQTTSPCLESEIEQGDGCISICQYCADNPGASQCAISGSKFPIEFNKGFSCSCGLKECNDNLYPKGLCAPFAGFCPAASYCCEKPCKDTETRGADGKCYPRCSECSLIKTDCACGEGTLAKTGEYCCPETMNALGTLDECKQDCAAQPVIP